MNAAVHYSLLCVIESNIHLHRIRTVTASRIRRFAAQGIDMLGAGYAAKMWVEELICSIYFSCRGPVS